MICFITFYDVMKLCIINSLLQFYNVYILINVLYDEGCFILNFMARIPEGCLANMQFKSFSKSTAH